MTSKGDDRALFRTDSFPRRPNPRREIKVEIVGSPTAAQYLSVAKWMHEKAVEAGAQGDLRASVGDDGSVTFSSLNDAVTFAGVWARAQTMVPDRRRRPK